MGNRIFRNSRSISRRQINLHLNGIEMTEMNDYGSRKMFVFEDNEQYQKLKKAYYWNQATVDPLQYKQGIRELKGLMNNH